jgi:hypothetical protein
MVQWKKGEQCEPGIGNECGPHGECIDCACVSDSLCGNGIVNWNAGETCEPPGSVCGWEGNSSWICSDTCQCEYVGLCGDGKVQWNRGEECELGVGNECGPYGECIDCRCVAE